MEITFSLRVYWRRIISVAERRSESMDLAQSANELADSVIAVLPASA
jgi:hypothetical protein